MAFRKSLTNIVVAGALALGGTGCYNNPKNHFDGEIGRDHVHLWEPTFLGIFNEVHLEVVKADGSKLDFVDYGKDLTINDHVTITIGKNTTTYNVSSQNPAIKVIIQKAQEEFDRYLSEITEIQTDPLYR